MNPRPDHLLTLDDDAVGFTPSALAQFRHRLAELGLFTDEGLSRLLDGYPGEDLNITTMGHTGMADGWREGRVGGADGAEVIEAIRKGHLWLNVKYLDRHAPEYGALVTELYEEIAAQTGTAAPTWRAATLLISSPGASVHYHADSIPNILWHIRGRKKVMVYPAGDPFFASAEEIEKICAGEKDENLPYREDFERAAQTVDLEPGMAVMWPQNAPHRVQNTSGLNVSLSTEHLTPVARRRVNIHRGNRILRRLKLSALSRGLEGPTTPMKVGLALAHRGLRKIRRAPRVSFQWPCTFRVDATSPTGFADEETP